MKRINVLFFIAFFVLLVSCEKELCINLGFDSTIDKNSNGLLIANISLEVEIIYLRGVICLLEGELLINLINSDGVAVYSKKIIAPTELHINEVYIAKYGSWKLKYSSKEGIGKIDLHILK